MDVLQTPRLCLIGCKENEGENKHLKLKIKKNLKK